MIDDISEMRYCEECNDWVAIKTVVGNSVDGEAKWETVCTRCGNILGED